MKIRITTYCLSVLFFASSCKDSTVSSGVTTAPQINHNIEKEAENLHRVATISSESVNDPLALKLKKYLAEDFLTEADNRAIEDKDRLFQLYEIDLNNDGKNEVFVNLPSQYFCGSGGCTLLLLNSDLKLVTKFTVIRTPLYAEKELVNGYKKLLTKSEGEWKELDFDGKKYPSNSSLLKKSSYADPGYEAEVIFDDKYLKAKTYTF